MGDRLIFHVDVNSAFLSWESTRRVKMGLSDLRLVPSCIGGNKDSRSGIVLAKSIPAKQYGINTGEPMSMALRKCPNLETVPPDFYLYQKCSKAFKDICRDYTPAMESFSIDEVFMDMSGMGKIYPDPIKTAYEIKDTIRDVLGFTVNVGIGENKLCAKMASDFEKPDKVHTLFMHEIEEKMWPLPVGELFTVGKATRERLTSVGINTIGDLAKADVAFLKTMVGEKQGEHIHRFANGIDDDIVRDVPEDAKGYSVETTVEEDLVDYDRIFKILLEQVDIVTARMRRENARCTCVSVTFRDLGFHNKSHQRKLSDSTNVTEEIFEIVKNLFVESWDKSPLRLIGVALSGIDRSDFEQLTFEFDDKKERLKQLDQAVDAIRNKYGNASIKRASTMHSSGRIGGKYKAQMENDKKNNKE